MARGRKSKYVKVITNREEKLFKQLARTGLSDRVQAKLFCNLNTERLKKLENSGYIKLSNHAVKGENTEIIQLANKGKAYCTENLNINSFAAAQTNHLTHDLRLSATYYALPEKQQETWKHEREIIKEIYEKHPDMKGKLTTCIDAKITVESVDMAIEVIGDSYGKTELDLKQEIALEYAGCESIEFV
ncbi:MAG: hypothetical protein JJT76_15600 [Clostridiaceae bacterium]|nr:hypothetical protein [Clostridiaceae bacterium]